MRRRLRSLARLLARALIAVIIFILILAGVGITTLETGWAKNQIRALIVRQANQYLTARLEIGELSGSLFRGLQLGAITLSRDGRPLVSIDNIALSYSIRELFQSGVVIKRLSIIRPKVTATRLPDGRWDLGALVKREAREEERTGPGRPIEIQSIEIADATIVLSEGVSFGAAHIPTRYEKLDAAFSFKYVPVRWALDFARLSFRGSAPDLMMNKLSGGLGNGPAGLTFRNFEVNTARSSFTLDGQIERGEQPATLSLDVHAPKFTFQEWGGIINGLRNIAVTASFDTTLTGPLTRMQTDLAFTSNGGGIHGAFALNTTVPGWAGSGTVMLDRLDLARWLNNPKKPSDITGRVTFDMDFGFGQHLPRGTYAFDGARAMFMNYAGADVHAKGRLANDSAFITEATAQSYGATVRVTAGSIGLREPFPYHFPGTVNGIDLRQLPPEVPVPHVESLLTFEYDVTGRFSEPFITGRARFARSGFLGAVLGDGVIGSIDTSVKPLAFSGEGPVEGVNMRRFGEGLDVEWMRDPRYAGTISGQFHAEGSAGGRAMLRITGGGRISRAEMMGGRFEDADVSLDIAGGTLRATYDGGFVSIDPALPFQDDRYKASLTGTAKVSFAVNELLLRTATAADYDIDGGVRLTSSTIRGFEVETADFDGSFRDRTVLVRQLSLAGPALAGSGAGSIGVDSGPIEFQYDVTRADLAALKDLTKADLSGELATMGRLSGSFERPHFAGTASVVQFRGPEVEALTALGTYEGTWASGGLDEAIARADLHGSFVKLVDRSIEDVTGTLALADRRATFDFQLASTEGRKGRVAGAAALRTQQSEADLLELGLTFGTATWKLTASGMPPTVGWKDDQVSVERLVLAGPAADERISVEGTFRRSGGGALQITASHVSLDTIQGAFEAPARYGGVMDLEATIRGTRQQPIIAGRINVTDGRVRRVTYQRLAGQVTYTDGAFDLDLRLDQAPGVWVQAKGKMPMAVIDRTLPERAIDVAIVSSAIDLGLVEGLTDVVRNVSGVVNVDLNAVGTSHDPHFRGTVAIAGAGFVATTSGSRYKNGAAALRVSPERVDIEALHLEDNDGDPLDVRGSLGTHEMNVGDLAIEVAARKFEVLRNDFGRIDVDAMLSLRGRSEAPRLVGDLTITEGTLNVDRILEETLFQPYSTEPMTIDVDAVRALNPWTRLALDLTLHIPRSLRVIGEDLQVTQNTPIGLGNIRLRVGGDVYLYKDRVLPLSATGSLYSLSGTYEFQGRRFEIDEATSSITFVGDLNPQMYVAVTRAISGVDTRVLIAGDLNNPTLRLSSNPPLDDSDILSLIVFNSSANDLTAVQQQELAVRAGTIAAGFFAKPLVTAIERSLGLEILEIEANGDNSRGPRVTIGQEIAPGLVARYTRQFGSENFDEATIEYYLSRLLRIRATFSDASALSARSPFRRIERAGIDLLVFLSF